MRCQRIVIYEPVRETEPGAGKIWGPLWLAVIVLLLVSWGLSWMWREAETVIRRPMDAPSHTFIVLAIYALAHGLLVWWAFLVLRRVFNVGRAMILALSDLVSGVMRSIRDRSARTRN